MAVSLWQLVFSQVRECFYYYGDISPYNMAYMVMITMFQEEPALLKKWLHFLEKHPQVRFVCYSALFLKSIRHNHHSRKMESPHFLGPLVQKKVLLVFTKNTFWLVSMWLIMIMIMGIGDHMKLRFKQRHLLFQVRGIPRDTWNMFLNFTTVVGSDLSQYDDTEAWPRCFLWL